MTRYKIIVNPVSGRGAGESAIPTIERRLREYSLDHHLVCTERPGHASELARKAAADGYDVVVAVGGDGIANEVLNGLMLAKNAGEGMAVLGLIGLGRGNDFAFGSCFSVIKKIAYELGEQVDAKGDYHAMRTQVQAVLGRFDSLFRYRSAIPGAVIGRACHR